MSSVHDERVEALESRVAFQEATIDQLNDEVALQAREINTLKRQIHHLNAIVQSLKDNGLTGSIEQEPPPPHY